ncbi:MAG: FIST N-terminal domain-containing protein, partial [Myxococcota bacterium]
MTLKLGSGTSTRAGTDEAVAEAFEHALAALDGARPRLAVVVCTVEHDSVEVLDRLARITGELPIAGATSSLGVLTPDGFAMGANGAVGVLLFGGDGFEIAAASAEIEPGCSGAGKVAATRLREQLTGSPSMLMMFGVPGCEEGLLDGVAEVFPDVPLIGGSAADHAIAGDWRVIHNDGVSSSAIALVALGGEIQVGTSYIAPYR